MIAALLFAVFLGMMAVGVPIGAALGLAGTAAIAIANAGTPWFGLLAVPQNFYAGLGKYPLLAIPMFVLVGSIFDRSGVALRLVNFAVATSDAARACCRWWPSPWRCSWAGFPAPGPPTRPPWAG